VSAAALLPFALGIVSIASGTWLVMFTAPSRGDWLLIPGGVIATGVALIATGGEIL
jgi:hypothetical protein